MPASTPVHDNDSTTIDQTASMHTAIHGPVQQNHHQQTSGLEENPESLHASTQTSIPLSPPSCTPNSAQMNSSNEAPQQLQMVMGKHAADSSGASALQVSPATADSQNLPPQHGCAGEATKAKSFGSNAPAFPPRNVRQPSRDPQAEEPQQPNTVLQTAGVSLFPHAQTPSSGPTKHVPLSSETQRAAPDTQAQPDLLVQANGANEVQVLLASSVGQKFSYASVLSAGIEPQRSKSLTNVTSNHAAVANNPVHGQTTFNANRIEGMPAESSGENVNVKHPCAEPSVRPEDDANLHNYLPTNGRERGVGTTDSYAAVCKKCDTIVSQGDWTAAKHPKRLSGGDTSCHSNIHSHPLPVHCTNRFSVPPSDSSSNGIKSGETKASGDGAVTDSLTATADSHEKSEIADVIQAADNTKSEPNKPTEKSTGAQNNCKEPTGASARRCSCRMLSSY